MKTLKDQKNSDQSTSGKPDHIVSDLIVSAFGVIFEKFVFCRKQAQDNLSVDVLTFIIANYI